MDRTLFTSDGAIERTDAYQLIDQAQKGTYFYRFVINLDPKTEDNKQDLHLREITEHIMQTLQERIQKQIPWFAAIHDDHTDLRHAHGVVLLPHKLNVLDLQFLTQQATEAALQQRQERDLIHQQEQEKKRKEEEWDREP